MLFRSASLISGKGFYIIHSRNDSIFKINSQILNGKSIVRFNYADFNGSFPNIEYCYFELPRSEFEKLFKFTPYENNNDADNKSLDDVYVDVEEMPVYRGGEAGLREIIRQNLKYPKIASENGIEGTVYVSLVVDKDGMTTEVKVEKGVDASLDREAVRVVQLLGRWARPGYQDNRPVKVKYTIPVNFILH